MYLIKITQEEKQWLIDKGYLKHLKGKYQGLVVCNKDHSSKSKTYYVEDRYVRWLNRRNKK